MLPVRSGRAKWRPGSLRSSELGGRLSDSVVLMLHAIPLNDATAPAGDGVR
jgi:hypothetical protein